MSDQIGLSIMNRKVKKTVNIKDKVTDFSQSNKCGRCVKTVYHAEETRAFGKVWHTTCFVCSNLTCKKRLDSTNSTDHKGDIYCKKCYANAFGPKGYGFAGGAAGSMTLTNPSTVMSAPTKPMNTPSSSADSLGGVREREKCSPFPTRYKQGSRSPSRGVSPSQGQNENCGRCNKKVYAAEKVWGPGKDQPWHQTCLSCKTCGKRLDSATMKAYQNEVYCTACYNKDHTPLAKR